MKKWILSFFIFFIMSCMSFSSSLADLPFKFKLTPELDRFSGELQIFRNHTIRLINDYGKILDEWRPAEKTTTVTIEEKQIKGRTLRIVIITEHPQIDFGSYNGTMSHILSISHKKIGWSLSMAKSLKNSWGFGTSGTAEENDIFTISCAPDGNSKSGFKTTYSQHHRNKQLKWDIILSETQDEFWESEDDGENIYKIFKTRNIRQSK